MQSSTLEKPQETSAGNPEIGHYYCIWCRPEADQAFCGTQLVPEEGECPEDEVDCVVCLDVYYCPECSPSEDSNA